MMRLLPFRTITFFLALFIGASILSARVNPVTRHEYDHAINQAHTFASRTCAAHRSRLVGFSDSDFPYLSRTGDIVGDFSRIKSPSRLTVDCRDHSGHRARYQVLKRFSLVS